jgi:RNA polymerase sigma factor (sigma-70 family)
MDRDRFARHVAELQPVLSRFCARYLPSREDADEVVQETFLRAWAQIRRYREGSHFAAWLMTIARFLCLARLKDSRRHRPPAPLHDPPPPIAPEGLPEDLERLRGAWETLPFVQREVVALRYFDGLDYRNIAAVTGDSEVALRSRLHDALQRLREILSETPRFPATTDRRRLWDSDGPPGPRRP